jgi:hypothetical protein
MKIRTATLVAAVALSSALLSACAVEAQPYGYGPARPGPVTYRPAPILAPGEVVHRLHDQGYRRVESVTFRPVTFWRGRGLYDDRVREGAYVAEIDRARRPDAYVIVNPHTGQVVRDYHGRL